MHHRDEEEQGALVQLGELCRVLKMHIVSSETVCWHSQISSITLLLFLFLTNQRRRSCLLHFYSGISSALMALVKATQLGGMEGRWKRDAPVSGRRGVLGVNDWNLSLQNISICA